MRFKFFDSPRRCIYPISDDALKSAVKSIVIALKKKDMPKAISLWHRYRKDEPEEHLMRFKSLWEHPISAGLHILNQSIGKSRPYKTRKEFRVAFRDGAEEITELEAKDRVVPTRVRTFQSIFGIPQLYIPRLSKSTEDI